MESQQTVLFMLFVSLWLPTGARLNFPDPQSRVRSLELTTNS